jgi:hypothetical protein
MPATGVTDSLAQAITNRRLPDRESFFYHLETFTSRPLPLGTMQGAAATAIVAPAGAGGNAAADIDTAISALRVNADASIATLRANINAAIASIAVSNRVFCLTGTGASIQPGESADGDAGTGGIFIATRTTGAAANDTTNISPFDNPGGAPAAQLKSLVCPPEMSPVFELEMAHATALVANNGVSQLFMAGLRTVGGTFNVNNAAIAQSADGAFFSYTLAADGTGGVWTCNVRVADVTTSQATTVPSKDVESVLRIVFGTDRRPNFYINDVLQWCGPAVTLGAQLLPIVTIKTTANAPKKARIFSLLVARKRAV